jgi:hypothetical protein
MATHEAARKGAAMYSSKAGTLNISSFCWGAVTCWLSSGKLQKKVSFETRGYYVAKSGNSRKIIQRELGTSDPELRA